MRAAVGRLEDAAVAADVDDLRVRRMEGDRVLVGVDVVGGALRPARRDHPLVADVPVGDLAQSVLPPVGAPVPVEAAAEDEVAVRAGETPTTLSYHAWEPAQFVPLTFVQVVAVVRALEEPDDCAGVGVRDPRIEDSRRRPGRPTWRPAACGRSWPSEVRRRASVQLAPPSVVR